VRVLVPEGRPRVRVRVRVEGGGWRRG
jgi:hypothetical protein